MKLSPILGAKALALGSALMAILALSGATLTLAPTAQASNPFITTTYNADPSARVFNGRLYVYPTHDAGTRDYRCYSTDDMVNWQDHGVIFSVAQSTWAKGPFWAPDCIAANGQYYLYYPSQDASGLFNIGVAVSSSPTGPFVDTNGPIPGTGANAGLDPNVFIDDNGQGYLLWAAAGLKVCALASNMTTLSGATVSPSGCTNFFEGPWMFKRNGLYYLTYAAFMPGGSGQGGNGQYFDYATATNIMGPYTYRGHFSRTSPNEPQAVNIHGSQVLWNGNWYCFYHDFPAATPGSRLLNVDLLNFNGDGTLQTLQWTTSGPPAVKTLNPYLRCEAETLNQTDLPNVPHAVIPEPCSEGGLDIGTINAGAWLKYGNVGFGTGATSFQARVASPNSGGSLQVHLDSITGPLVGTASVPNTGGWQNWQTVSCPVSGVSGTHDLFLVASGGGGSLFNINWFQFNGSTGSRKLVPGASISLKAIVNSQWVSAENAGSNPLLADRPAAGTWETFTVVDAGNGNIGLKALANGEYVCADNAGASPLIANRTAVGQWETFTEVDAGNGNIGLLALANGDYVCADNVGSNPLIANRTAVGLWESFTALVH